MQSRRAPNTARRDVPLYTYYIVAVLLLAYVLSFMDRTVLSLLIDPIRRDLGLTDTSISALIGFGFVLVYSGAGLLLGRWADFGDRRLLIAAGLLVWSLATASSAYATGFASLLVARLLVGLGEATLSPASYSLIASYFPRERLGLGTSIYALGTVLGSGVASALIGTVAHLAVNAPALPGTTFGSGGWRFIYGVVGLLGVPFVLVILTIREPRNTATAPSIQWPMQRVLRQFWGHRGVYSGIMIGYAVMTITSFTAVIWGPSYFIRAHDYTPSSVGAMFGAVMGIGGAAGVLSGGILTDWLSQRGTSDAAPRVVIASLLIQALLFPCAYMAANTVVAVALFAAATYFMAFQGGLQGASIAAIAPEQARGLAMAAYLLVANVIGMGCGPLIVALLTDRVFGNPTAVGKSLAVVSVVSSITAATIVFTVLPSYRRHLEADIHRYAPTGETVVTS